MILDMSSPLFAHTRLHLNTLALARRKRPAHARRGGGEYSRDPEAMSAPTKKAAATVINFGKIVAKRIKKGLYAGRNIQFGNNVSADGGNKCVPARRVRVAGTWGRCGFSK